MSNIDNNGEVHLAADNIFNDIIADFGKFIEGLLHPTIDLPSVDLPSVNLPSASVGLNIGSPLSLSVAQTPKPTPKPTPETTPKGKLSYNKRAIYDMDGSYSESSASESAVSNEYSAQDFYPASASASVSEAYHLPHAASVKAVLKARRSEAYASASARASASASASASEAAISAVSSHINHTKYILN